MKASTDAGEGAIDVLRTMRECQKRMKASNERVPEGKKKETMHADDGIHLNDLGHTAMAFAILEGLGAPREVSSATIDSSDGKAVGRAARSQASNRRQKQSEFDRLDEGLPFNQRSFSSACTFSASRFRTKSIATCWR